MDLNLIVGENSVEGQILIQPLPPGKWKFKAHSDPITRETLADFSDEMRDVFYQGYPFDKEVLERFFDGDEAIWSRIGPDTVPLAFYYTLKDQSVTFEHCIYSPYLPPIIFAPKISPRWTRINKAHCQIRRRLFFTKICKNTIKWEKMEQYNNEVIDFFELYQEKYDIVTGLDISVELKKIMQAPIYIPHRSQVESAKELKKRLRWEFSQNDALGKSLMLPEKYRSREAINNLFPHISVVTFYEIEESDLDGSGHANYCGLNKVLNFNLIDLLPAWSQNLTTINYIITRKSDNLDAYKGNLRKLLQIANSCPNLVDFSIAMPYTQEGAISLVNGKGRKVGDWSFISRLCAFQISFPLVCKGPLKEFNELSNQRELMNIFKRLDPKKLVDFGLHITGRPRLWMEVLHRLQAEAPEIFKKINKLRLPKNSPNTRPDFIMLACQCFQLKYLDFYLHNYHYDFMMLANLHRSLTTLILRSDTQLKPITNYTMRKMPVFWSVETLRIAATVGASSQPAPNETLHTLPRHFIQITFPNADPYLSMQQLADNNLLDRTFNSKFVVG